MVTVKAEVFVEMIDGVPKIFVTREMVEFCLILRRERDSMAPDPTKDPKLFTEINARVNRLEKAFYYRCEISNEPHLISSLEFHKGKIVARKIMKSLNSVIPVDEILAEMDRINDYPNTLTADEVNFYNKIYDMHTEMQIEDPHHNPDHFATRALAEYRIRNRMARQEAKEILNLS